MNKKSQVVDLPLICRNYPDVAQKEIGRDYLLDTIDQMFGNMSVVVLEGEEGVGKTVLLAQYGRRYPNTAISCFINPYSKIGYNPEYVRLVLAEQLFWIITKKPYGSDSIDSFRYNELLFRLQRMAKNRRAPYVFLIDGIDDIPEEDKKHVDIILRELLPIGQPWLKFLFTGASASSYPHIEGISQPWRVTPFGVPEVREYFSDLNLDSEQLDLIKHMCRGIPGHLSSVRRLLVAGKSVQEITEENPKAVPDFIKLEFKTAGTLSGRLSNILAILAFSFSRFSTKDIATILGDDEANVERDVSACPVLQIEPTSKVLSFISNPHHKFAQTQLIDKKQWAIDAIIEYLKAQTDTLDRLTELPQYLRYANRCDELLNQLTHDHLAKLVMKTETISPLITQIDLGLNASVSLNRYISVFNYSVLKSLSLELGGIEISNSEIEARMVLSEVEEAISLANSAVLKEDRLRLLSIIARYTQEHGLKVEEALKAQIQMLANQIDFSASGSEATIVASNLIWIDPDLAINILEKATEKSDDRDADLAFAQLSIMAQASELPESGTDHLLKKALSKIHDPKMQDFLSRAKVFFGKCAPEEVIERLKGSEFRTKLFCLRNWAKVALSCKNPQVVLNYALDEMVKNTAYMPKIKDLCDFAQTLPQIESSGEAKQLVNQFDSIIASVQQYGCSQDNTKIQILLAEAERKYDERAYSNRIIDLSLEIGKIPDLAVKSECLAMIKVALAKLDPSRIMEEKEQLHSYINEELEESVSQLLQGSADHFQVLKGTIDVLASNDPYAVMGIIGKMNTRSRRDQAYHELSNRIMQSSINSLDFGLLQKIVTEYVTKETGWQILVRLFAKVLSEREKVQPSHLAVMEPFITMLEDIQAAPVRCNAACLAYSLFKSFNITGKYTLLCDKLENLMTESLAVMDPSWEKIEAGNRIAINLARSESEKAKQYLLKSRETANGVAMEAEKSAEIHLMILLLAIRSYPGLISRDKEAKDEFAVLEHLIGLVPSVGEQIGLWANLALLNYTRGNKDVADMLVRKHVLPSLENFPPLGHEYKAEIVKRIAPALYYHHKSIAFEFINALSDKYRDVAFYQICDHIFTKTAWTEPYEMRLHRGFKLTYAEALDICEVLEEMKTDIYLYSTIENLVESMLSKSSKYSINEIQINHVRDKLRKIIQAKLPDSNNIRHEGFKIVAEAQVMRLDKRSKSDWMGLVQRTTLIPNVADRAHIFPVLTHCMPSALGDLKADCIKKAITEAEQIPTDIDKIDHYIHIAEQIQSVDEPASRRVLKIAMQVSTMSEDPEMVYPKQKRIINNANRMSPEFAEELADLFDCDPARMKARIDSLSEEPDKIIARFNLRDYLKMIKARNDMLSKKLVPQKTKLVDNLRPEMAWRTLAILNADLVTPISFEETCDYLAVASKLPLREAYPIYIWSIANLTKRLENTPSALGMVEPIFQSLVALSNFTLSVHSRAKAQFKRFKTGYPPRDIEEAPIVIDSDDQDQVNEFIRKWLSEELGDYLYICDPYFRKDDLAYIKMVSSVKHDCQVYIITGEANQGAAKIRVDVEYRSEWKRISEEVPPPTEIIVASLVSGQPAFHDRFWLTSGSGLSFGTSLGAIGSPRKSHISVMRMEEYEKWSVEIIPFIERRRDCGGKIVNYLSFSL